MVLSGPLCLFCGFRVVVHCFGYEPEMAFKDSMLFAHQFHRLAGSCRRRQSPIPLAGGCARDALPLGSPGMEMLYYSAREGLPPNALSHSVGRAVLEALSHSASLGLLL